MYNAHYVLQVLQKLNSKTNAAGWLLSSANRTAQAFSQPGKGMPGVRIPTAFPPVRQPIKPVGYVFKFNIINKFFIY